MKSRFCPSPTGYMHIGNVRTALFNTLIAIATNDNFLLRIEDTDKERSKQIYIDELINDLKWLNLNWQDGPYYQSKRGDIYAKYYQKLQEDDNAYLCFCSEEKLANARKIELAKGRPPRYLGTCRHLTETEINKKLAKKIPATLRFKIAKNITIKFNDLVHGEQKFNSNDLGDFIIRRADGSASFLFCNAIDDSLMAVKCAMRGDDHLTNSPRQLLILRALNLPEPQYAHISLITGTDKLPLSKRNGSRSVNELRQQSYLSLAIINYLARLGHHYGHDELMSLQELGQNFKIKNLIKSPARFDIEQLNRWQKIVVNNLTEQEFINWLTPTIKNIIPKTQLVNFINVIKNNCKFLDEVKQFAEIFFCKFKLNYTQITEMSTNYGLILNSAIEILKNRNLSWSKLTKQVAEDTNIRGKALFMTFRIAITGLKHGPDMNAIFNLLGKNEIINRMQVLTKC